MPYDWRKHGERRAASAGKSAEAAAGPSGRAIDCGEEMADREVGARSAERPRHITFEPRLNPDAASYGDQPQAI
jgi:hypothetical protein